MPTPPGNDARDLATTFLRLRADASIEALPVDAGFWERLGSGALGAFHNEYLVTTLACAADWPQWEMHPHGDEVVCLLSGALTLVLDDGTQERRVALATPGSFVIVPCGVWHTAAVGQPSRLLFITAGEGTQHRPRAVPALPPAAAG